MAEDQEPSGPSLEPPSFFRRKTKKKDAETPLPEPAAAAAPADDSPTTILDDIDDTVAGPPVPVAPSAPGPEPTGSPVAVAPLAPGPEATPPPLFADELPAGPAASSDPEPSPTTPTDSQLGSLDAPPVAPAAVTEEPARPPRRVRPPRTGPPLPGRVAAALAGLLVGALIVGLTSASFGLCGRIQGTSSCGGPGFFLLVGILALAVLLGTVVLRLSQVAEPGSTSFLAVGMTSVIAMLFLIDALFEWWMVIVIPLVSIATFLLSHWVTATFVEPARQVNTIAEPEVVDHDVR